MRVTISFLNELDDRFAAATRANQNTKGKRGALIHPPRIFVQRGRCEGRADAPLLSLCRPYSAARDDGLLGWVVQLA